MIYTYEEYLKLFQYLGIKYKTRTYSNLFSLHVLYKDQPRISIIFDKNGNLKYNQVILTPGVMNQQWFTHSKNT